MIIKVLAETCRDGNCPRVSATTRGTVLVQGYRHTVAVARHAAAGVVAVEVPEALLVEAAASMAVVLPAPRSPEGYPVVVLTGEGAAVVPGDATTADARAVATPEGEAVVEVPAQTVLNAARRILAAQEVPA